MEWIELLVTVLTLVCVIVISIYAERDRRLRREAEVKLAECKTALDVALARAREASNRADDLWDAGIRTNGKRDATIAELTTALSTANAERAMLMDRITIKTVASTVRTTGEKCKHLWICAFSTDHARYIPLRFTEAQIGAAMTAAENNKADCPFKEI